MNFDHLHRTAASVKKLQEIKDVTPELARYLREIWHTYPNRRTARESIDKLLNTCGVEYLGRHRRSNEHVYYCNAGDTYSTTVLFIGTRMIVGCWGDLVENNTVRDNN